MVEERLTPKGHLYRISTTASALTSDLGCGAVGYGELGADRAGDRGADGVLSVVEE
jgi:hypothetical protein